MFIIASYDSIDFFKDPVMKEITDDFGPMKIIESKISPNSTVLDVGCNSGLLAWHLRHKNCLVDGIDINQKALKQASKRCYRVYCRDLYKPNLALGRNKYDYIVFSDILEHLPNPDLLLIDAKKYLKPEGRIFVSLPNVARIELRMAHMLGKFEYKPGIMGPDHLRFFTFNTASELLKKTGFKIIKTYSTGLGQRIKIFPKLFSFQFVFECEI